MKFDKGIMLSGIVLILLALYFFTPVGEKISEFLNEKTLFGQSKEKIDRNFNFNDEAFAISLNGFNGTPNIELQDFKGKVVFLNFWGSWCPPCVEEMPSIQKLYESKGKDVAFVLITMKDKPEKFVPFLQKNNYTMPVFEANSLVPKQLIPFSFPTTYIFNKQGEVVLKEINSVDWNSPEIHKLLDDLLKS